jgi:hypothetical protein
MAVVLIEGFDHLTAAEMTAKGWSQVLSMVTGRFGGQATSTNSNALTTKALPSTYSTLFVGFAFQMSAVGTQTFWAIMAGATSTLQLQLDGSNHIVVKNSSGTTIATGTTVLNTATWYFIEIKLVVNGASGSVIVNLNGVAEITVTTGNFGSTNVDHIGYSRPSGTTGQTASFDDIYCVDTTGSSPRNTFLGDVRVATIYPTADGAHTAWTPNSGTTHFTQVDEVQADGDTTYVSDSTPGDIDSYTFGDIDTGATVYGVQTNLYARKDDANTRQIAPVIRQSGSDNVGTTVTLSSSYVDYTQIYNQDPTSSDWTPTTVNADEFGVKEIA